MDGSFCPKLVDRRIGQIKKDLPIEQLFVAGGLIVQAEGCTHGTDGIDGIRCTQARREVLATDKGKVVVPQTGLDGKCFGQTDVVLEPRAGAKEGYLCTELFGEGH